MMIHTDRLLIRRFEKTDGPGLHAYLSDPEVVRVEPYPPLSDADCEREAANRAGNPSFRAVCLRVDGALLGHLSLDKPDFDTSAIGSVFVRSR